MKILLIDNYDSFTFNIVEQFRYLKINIEVITINNLNDKLLKDFSKIIISPGPGNPQEKPLIKQFINSYKAEKSILGVCLGHQVICHYFGANLYNLSEPIHGQAHTVFNLNNSNLFKDIPSEFKVGLYHSWAVSNDNLPKDLSITGISEHDIIMAIKHNKYDINSVQFHPESFISEYGINIFNNFTKY